MNQERDFEVLDNFIVFEGLDGSGTTTQAYLLEQRLAGNGPTYLTCEPTGTFIGKSVREILRGEQTVAEGTLARLFAVDRYNHLYHPEEGVTVHAERGTKVISDRYLFSSLAYQSIERPFEEVWDLNKFFPLPRHLIYLDISPEEGNARLDNRGIEREMYEKMELQQEVRENYYHIFSLYQKSEMKIHVFDASLEKEVLAKNIWQKLNNFA